MPPPRSTFLNLPEEKRARFIEAAVAEFAAHPYDHASVSRIVSQLGIAKGSFYQYFEDKRDLFLWLVEESGRRKLGALEAQSQPEGADFFGRLRWLYLQGLLFQAQSPQWARIGLRALEQSQDPDVSALRRRYIAASQDYLREILRQGQEEGAVRADLDLELVAPLLYGLLSEGLLRAFLHRAGTDDPLDPAVQSLSRRDALAVVDAALVLLRSGLGWR